MPERTNQDRARSARAGLELLTRETYGGGQFAHLHPDDELAVIKDGIINLLHLANERGHDVEQLHADALFDFDAEVALEAHAEHAVKNFTRYAGRNGGRGGRGA